MDSIVRLTELQTRHAKKATDVIRIEERLSDAHRNLDAKRSLIALELQDAYYELFTLKDQINELEAQIEYDTLPFYKKLFTKKP